MKKEDKEELVGFATYNRLSKDFVVKRREEP
jgi:hypothetical protein